jgi:phosphoglycolate phosphatase-like HAD superfamily hydrolase
LEPISGIREVIESLSSDYIQVINSSAEKDLIEEYLGKYQLDTFFAKIYGKEIPSKTEKFKLIFEEHSTTAKDCLMITDTLGDVIESQMVNVHAIVVLWGYHTKEYFSSVVDTVSFVLEPSEISTEVTRHFNRAN